MNATVFDKLTALTLGRRTVAERRNRLTVAERDVDRQTTTIRQYLERFDERIDDLRRLYRRSRQQLSNLENQLRLARADIATQSDPDRKLVRIHEFLSLDCEALRQKANRRHDFLREREATRRQIARRLSRVESRTARKLDSARLQLEKETSVRGIAAKTFDTVATLLIANQIRKHLFADAGK